MVAAPKGDVMVQARVCKQLLVLLELLLPNNGFRTVDHPACVGMHMPFLTPVNVVTYHSMFDNVYRS